MNRTMFLSGLAMLAGLATLAAVAVALSAELHDDDPFGSHHTVHPTAAR
jgi:hypothetical protein